MSGSPRHLMETSTRTDVLGPSSSATAAAASDSQCPLVAPIPLTPFAEFTGRVPMACLS